jgi:hypothetical protein
MDDTPANVRPLLLLGIGILIAVYALIFLYALIFFGALEPRAIVRVVLVGAFGMLAVTGRRWSGWVLTVLALAWTAEQAMWGLRGSLDSFLAAVGLLAGFVVLLTFMMQTRASN